MVGSVLTVNVIQARDLKALDMSGKSDPYCIVIFQGQELRTQIQKSTLNPIWEEECAFDVSGKDEIIKVYVFDKDYGTDQDDFLGQTFIDIQQL